jgi:hypothetical protein
LKLYCSDFHAYMNDWHYDFKKTGIADLATLSLSEYGQSLFWKTNYITHNILNESILCSTKQGYFSENQIDEQEHVVLTKYINMYSDNWSY